MAEAKENATCHVCTEVYMPEGERVPLLLGCGHSFCAACLAIHSHGEEVKCPVCVATTQLGPDGVVSLKKNFGLIDTCVGCVPLACLMFLFVSSFPSKFSVKVN